MSVKREQSRRRWTSLRGQSSPTARLLAVTSTRHDPRDLAQRLNYLVGPLVRTSDDGGDHGGSEERDGGGTPEEATAAQLKARTSINELR